MAPQVGRARPVSPGIRLTQVKCTAEPQGLSSGRAAFPPGTRVLRPRPSPRPQHSRQPLLLRPRSPGQQPLPPSLPFAPPPAPPPACGVPASRAPTQRPPSSLGLGDVMAGNSPAPGGAAADLKTKLNVWWRGARPPPSPGPDPIRPRAATAPPSSRAHPGPTSATATSTLASPHTRSGPAMLYVSVSPFAETGVPSHTGPATHRARVARARRTWRMHGAGGLEATKRPRARAGRTAAAARARRAAATRAPAAGVRLRPPARFCSGAALAAREGRGAAEGAAGGGARGQTKIHRALLGAGRPPPANPRQARLQLANGRRRGPRDRSLAAA